MRISTNSFKLVLTFSLIVCTSLFGQLRLPKLISDGMVLQRDTSIKIWGWDENGQKVTVRFMNATYQTTTDNKGVWKIQMPEQKAGGPYEMQIWSGDTLIIRDIWIGDVWVCSGQSNMQVPLGWLVHVYQDEIDHSENLFIRQFSVPWNHNFTEREQDVSFGAWQSIRPETAVQFSAVAYFFAKKLYDAYQVPIGLLSASMGGSSAEAWISEESIRAFPTYYETAQRFKNPEHLKKINAQDNERVNTWNRMIREKDVGYPNGWWNPDLNDSDWETMALPGYWAKDDLEWVNGVVWFRKTIQVPKEMTRQPALLKLGRIVDADSVMINGQFVGATDSQYAQRMYPIPENLLQEGDNTLVIRVINQRRKGGFVPGKGYEIAIGNQKLDLTGSWKYKLGVATDPQDDRLFTGKVPTGLFNGMIAPLLNYPIKGAIWYQGESNTSRAFEHYELFKLLIKDWRQNWKQDDFPFLFAQLPNFVEVNDETTQYDWAYFRESQLKALSIPNTGMAVTIDIGEYNDIHPVNKKDVGTRLALAAQKVAYGETIVYSGPIYQVMTIEGNEIVLTFSNTGSGLIAKDSKELIGFEICGKDNIFLPAKAIIRKDKIMVRSDKISNPVAVRYAWDNNPEKANLYNKEGLPASPFRTSELY